MKRKFISDLFKYLPSKIVPAIIAFASLPIYTNIFSPKQFGDYTFVLSLITFLSTTVGWVNTSNVRYYPEYEKRGELFEYSSIVFKIALFSISIFTFFYVIGVFLFRDFIQKDLFSLMLISIFYFIFLSFFTIMQNFLRVNDKISLYSLSTIWRNVTSFAFGIILIFVFEIGIEGLLLGSILSLFFFFPVLFKYSFKKIDFSIPVNFELLKTFLLYSLPLVISNSFALLIKFSDRIFISYFLNNWELGIYSANYQLADQSIMLITTLFLYVSHPLAIKNFVNNGVKKSQEFLKTTSSLYLLISVPAIFGLSFLAKDISEVLFSSEYVNGFNIISFVSLGIFFYGLQQVFQLSFHFYGKTIYITYSIVIAGISNLLLNWILIPKLGLLGAAVSTLVSYMLMTFYIIILSRKFFKWDFPFVVLFKSLIGSGVMLMFMWVFEFSISFNNDYLFLFSRILLGTLVYFITIFLMKTFSLKDFKLAINKNG
ncbi:MAG: lipopolysaccharide biosynthesis protein [Algoriphagus aquaeductus]|uniref:lipopolysaccharide biosynthesis protein n=1 Tax=Algoriphagus aquaeductus TaxID=475299 RepID=UPI00391D9B73